MADVKVKEKLISDFKNSCRSGGFKVTPQRTIIYEELISSEDHPNVELLYNRVKKRLPDISFDTVYRTLMTFNELNLASVVAGLSATKRYDFRTEKHYHFICVRCGAIHDILDVPFKFDTPVSIKEKYNPSNIRIIFEGICTKCRLK
ncbi:MAG: Transcriptional regulator PerR [Actinobacteria bacterium ADurb.Bin346]|nr:MAG: Transcriptional regulator PerR [Actinobacteria bacterium ADurb.Bin346]